MGYRVCFRIRFPIRFLTEVTLLTLLTLIDLLTLLTLLTYFTYLPVWKRFLVPSRSPKERSKERSNKQQEASSKTVGGQRA